MAGLAQNLNYIVSYNINLKSLIKVDIDFTSSDSASSVHDMGMVPFQAPESPRIALSYFSVFIGGQCVS